MKALVGAVVIICMAGAADASQCDRDLARMRQALDQAKITENARDRIRELMKLANSKREAGKARACVLLLAQARRFLKGAA